VHDSHRLIAPHVTRVSRQKPLDPLPRPSHDLSPLSICDQQPILITVSGHAARNLTPCTELDLRGKTSLMRTALRLAWWISFGRQGRSGQLERAAGIQAGYQAFRERSGAW
jgi:hypothetical protein